MTAPYANQPGPQHPTPQSEDRSGEASPRYLRGVLWVAIGALIAAAIVCVIWVLVGSDNGIIGRAFLTILLLAGFGGVAIMDANLAPRRPAWFALASMIVWVVTLLIGAFLIWMPTDGYFFFDSGSGYSRFFAFLLIVLILQLGLLHVRLFTRAHRRYVTGFSTAITYVTVGLVVILAVMLVVPLTLHEWVDFPDLYWRIVVAVTILAAVGTALVPLINALFAPKKPRPQGQQQWQVQPSGGHAQGPAYPAPAPWPTFADGVTPLPFLPDGTPDWNAYYTGVPSVPQAPQAGEGHAHWHQSAPQGAAQQSQREHGQPHAAGGQEPPQQPGYQGYPPPPPVPPLPPQ